MTRLRLLAAAVVAAALLVPAAATAATDPGRWVQSNTTTLPTIKYYQGIASDSAGHVFFDGIADGLFRTDLGLTQQAAADPVIPASVTTDVGFNHIGDIAYSAGRVILPLECYDPSRTPANTCGIAGIGVADPTTLAWKYWVKLDPAQIQKAMWAAVSPDGTELYTSGAGQDIEVYDLSRITPEQAASATPLAAKRVLRNAVPPSGITGATFVGDRLYLAGQGGPDKQFQVWSEDPQTGGDQRLEIAAPWGGESEGLDTVKAFGGLLHWMIQPVPTNGSQPTFPGKPTLVSYVPKRGTGTKVVPTHSPWVTLTRAFRARLTVTKAGRVRLVLKRRGHRKGKRPRLGRVVFRLDGKRLATDRRAPFTARVKPGKRKLGRHTLAAAVHRKRHRTKTVRVPIRVK